MKQNISLSYQPNAVNEAGVEAARPAKRTRCGAVLRCLEDGHDAVQDQGTRPSVRVSFPVNCGVCMSSLIPLPVTPSYSLMWNVHFVLLVIFPDVVLLVSKDEWRRGGKAFQAVVPCSGLTT